MQHTAGDWPKCETRGEHEGVYKTAWLKVSRELDELRGAQPKRWAGCGECDPAFDCFNGECRCLRLARKEAK